MKHLFALLAWLLFPLVAHAATPSAKPVKVFLFAGQSNMVGSDARPERIDEFPLFKGVGAPQPEVLYTYLGSKADSGFKGWEPLRPLQSFGAELTFARRLRAQDDAPLAIIKSAIGGTTVAFDWNPDAPEPGQKLYPRTLALVQGALRDLEQRGIRYQLEAVIWHQGENDMLDRKLNTNYAAGFTKLIARLRTDLKAPQLKWFIGEVSEKGIWGMDNRHNLAILREQQDQVLAADPLLRWVPTSHLAFEVMNHGQPHYHFGTQGQLQMGEAFAAAYLKEIGKPLAPPDRSFKDRLPVAKGARVRLFVLAGQRNMEGEDAFASQIPQADGFAALAQAQKDVFYRYSLGGGVKTSTGWEPLGPVDYLDNFGPELSFGARLRKSLEARDGIAIVKFTHSGAQSPDWSPRGSPEARRNLYPKFIAFVRDAKADLVRQGYDCTVEGVFWHTGENDTFFGPYQRNYAAAMKELIAQTRLDLQQPALPWFISEQHPKAIWRNMEAVNTALKTMAQAEPKVFVIPTAQLPHERLHFGTRGTLLLGEELAQAYLKSR
ncbi:MAG: hypothetical protein EBS05_01815 [Proteobacteria bacterium]|nr:hypothetical protein [Pseudomonadota bacterium]